MRFLSVTFLLPILWSGTAEAQVDVSCEKFSCSGHGHCVMEDGHPTCACDDGFNPGKTSALFCVPSREHERLLSTSKQLIGWSITSFTVGSLAIAAGFILPSVLTESVPCTMGYEARDHTLATAILVPTGLFLIIAGGTLLGLGLEYRRQAVHMGETREEALARLHPSFLITPDGGFLGIGGTF